jgi:hypothetical protein
VRLPGKGQLNPAANEAEDSPSVPPKDSCVRLVDESPMVGTQRSTQVQKHISKEQPLCGCVFACAAFGGRYMSRTMEKSVVEARWVLAPIFVLAIAFFAAGAFLG